MEKRIVFSIGRRLLSPSYQPDSNRFRIESVPIWLDPTNMELAETTIITAKKKRLTRMTRERVTTLSALLLVIAKIEIEERIKIGRK
jgi:hypothetical protein